MQENEQQENPQNLYLNQEGYSRLERRRIELARRRNHLRRIALSLCVLVILTAFPVWFIKSGITHKQVSPVSTSKKVKPGIVVNKNNPLKKAIVEVEKSTVVPALKNLENNPVTFLAFGDMTFDHQVAAMIKSKGIQEPFAGVKTVLKTGDVVCGNLEGPLSASGQAVANKEYTFRGPPAVAEGMKASGINIVSLANNHIMDYGSDALVDTLNVLNHNGIAHAGAGMDSEQAYRPAVVNVKGKKVVFIAYSAIVPEGFWATANKPGMATTRTKWNALENTIRAAARNNDSVVVSFHWGIERQDTPQGYQVDLAKKAIDAGADIVVGHHPHVMQGIEIYKGKIIAFSLGNFIFEHKDSIAGETYILKVIIDGKTITKAEVIPVRISSNGKPSIVKGKDAQSILSRLKSISQPLGTTINVDDSVAEVKLK